MREILFRGKCVDDGKWVYWNFFGELCRESGKRTRLSVQKGATISFYDYIHQIVTLIDKNTICQFTGLLDKNGNKIWENDVCKGRYWENGNPHRLIGKVDYVYGEYLVCGVKQYEGFHSELNGAYEVIGNVFDNKELLEE